MRGAARLAAPPDSESPWELTVLKTSEQTPRPSQTRILGSKNTRCRKSGTVSKCGLHSRPFPQALSWVERRRQLETPREHTWRRSPK